MIDLTVELGTRSYPVRIGSWRDWDLRQVLRSEEVGAWALVCDRKVWEHLSHFYDVQAWLPRNTVFANKSAFNGLDAATKKVVVDCGSKAAADGLAKAKELTSFYLDGLRKGGMTVAMPSAGLKKELQGFGEVMTKEWLKAVGANGRAIIDAYQSN